VTRPTRPWTLLALPLLVAGCAAQHTAAAQAPASGPSAAAAVAAAPPASAAMVCGDEIRGKVQQALALPAQPATRATWAGGTYTCTYTLPAGPMTLTVQVLPGTAQAGAELDAGRARTAGAQPLAGLGERAWGTPAGTAVVLKDDQILTVDTTGLPEVFGVNDQKRADFAYEVASDVLGCWTGDGDE
jgi:hypothetical protein